MNLRPLILCLLPVACLDPSLQPPDRDDTTSSGSALTFTTTVAAETSPNTSASPSFTDRYEPATRFHGSATAVSNGDMAPSTRHVSKLPIRSLLYPGATTKIFVETQGWFCSDGSASLPTGAPADQCGGHIDNGNASNLDSYVKRAVDDMQSRGVDGVIADWQGSANGLGPTNIKSTSSSAISSAFLTLVRNEAEARGNFLFAVSEDEGIRDCASKSTCNVTDALINDLDFLAAHDFTSSAYHRIGGQPVVYFFGVDYYATEYHKTIDWNRVRSSANGNPLFIFEGSGGFSHGQSDGAYAWPKPTAYADSPGADPYDLKQYLPDFYNAGAAHPPRHLVAAAFKGFDDNLVNGWGGGRRYIGQQCGLTWLNLFADLRSRFSTSKPLETLQLVTWDDYEEGTELETGIDNHLALHESLSGTTLSWTLGADASAPADCAGVDLSQTVDHFTVFASIDGSNLAAVADNVPASQRSVDLTGKLPAGAYTLYVRATGRPSIRNTLSSPLAFTAHGGPGGVMATVTSPADGATVTQQVHVVASATASVHISQVQLWADGVKYGRYDGAAVDTVLTMPAGTHTLSFVVLDDSDTTLGSSKRTFTVVSAPVVTVTSPASGEAVTGPVHVVAAASPAETVSQLQIWTDGQKTGWYSGASVDATVSLPAGAHEMTVLSLDESYALITQTVVSFTSH